MALRVQKRWSQLGSPTKAGEHMARGVGKIVDLTTEHVQRALQLGDPIIVLEHRDAPGLVAWWSVVEIKDE